MWMGGGRGCRTGYDGGEQGERLSVVAMDDCGENIGFLRLRLATKI